MRSTYERNATDFVSIARVLFSGRASLISSENSTVWEAPSQGITTANVVVSSGCSVTLPVGWLTTCPSNRHVPARGPDQTFVPRLRTVAV